MLMLGKNEQVLSDAIIRIPSKSTRVYAGLFDLLIGVGLIISMYSVVDTFIVEPFIGITANESYPLLNITLYLLLITYGVYAAIDLITSGYSPGSKIFRFRYCRVQVDSMGNLGLKPLGFYGVLKRGGIEVLTFRYGWWHSILQQGYANRPSFVDRITHTTVYFLSDSPDTAEKTPDEAALKKEPEIQSSNIVKEKVTGRRRSSAAGITLRKGWVRRTSETWDDFSGWNTYQWQDERPQQNKGITEHLTNETVANSTDAARHLVETRFEISTENDPPVSARNQIAVPSYRLNIDGDEIYIWHGRVILGRNPKAVPNEPDMQTIKLRDESLQLSKTHCQIDLDDNNPWVTDLGSTNGTYVVDKHSKRVKLNAHQKCQLECPAILVMGQRRIKLEKT